MYVQGRGIVEAHNVESLFELSAVALAVGFGHSTQVDGAAFGNVGSHKHVNQLVEFAPNARRVAEVAVRIAYLKNAVPCVGIGVWLNVAHTEYFLPLGPRVVLYLERHVLQY